MVVGTWQNFPTKPPVHPDPPGRPLFLPVFPQSSQGRSTWGAEGAVTQVRVVGPSATMEVVEWGGRPRPGWEGLTRGAAHGAALLWL